MESLDEADGRGGRLIALTGGGRPLELGLDRLGVVHSQGELSLPDARGHEERGAVEPDLVDASGAPS